MVHLEIELQANLTVYIDEIRMGSTLAEDVFHILKDGSEVLLYARGQVINSPIQLQRLRSAGVKTILVDLNIPGLELNSNNHCSDEVIAGQHVLLLDDVCTTGNSLGACRQLLLDAGAAEVYCLVLAKTANPKQGYQLGLTPHRVL